MAAVESKVEGLSKYMFTAPSWQRSLIIMIFLGVAVDVVSLYRGSDPTCLGTLGYIIPGLIAFIFTKPLVEVFGKKITWNRSALLVLATTVFSLIITLFPIQLIFPGILPLLFAISLGFVFGVRLVVLVAIADYRMSRMILPAIVQSAFAAVAGTYFFGTYFGYLAILIHFLFGAAFIFFLWLVERPLKKVFHISTLNFINAFIAHNTDGSRALEDFFRKIGEEVFVPQVTLFFRREGKKTIKFTVPNVHPGPMGEIGGGNLPKIIHQSLGGETLVAHGCATHDFNLISENEIPKIISAIQATEDSVVYCDTAGPAVRYRYETVEVLAQPFGNVLLMVSTRSPEKTEDVDYPIGLSIMYEGQKRFEHVAFVDAHNCMVEVTSAVMPATKTAHEYMKVCNIASVGARVEAQAQFEAGASHVTVPFDRSLGFGDLGIQALAVRTGGKTTAYVIFDGNNMQEGVRENIREEVLKTVDDCELMTTDTHVVNTVSGRNPIGLRVPPEEIIPYVKEAVAKAVEDLTPSECGATTAWCEHIVVFGSHRISQLASTVNTLMTFIAPMAFAIILLAFIFTILAYMYLI